MKLIALIILLLIPSGYQDLDAETIATRVQNVYNGEISIEADFVQIYTSGTSGRAMEETGTLALKKPGRMRWEYKKPTKKYYVSDGNTAYWYVTSEKQVTKIDLERADQEQTQIMFLMGKGDLVRDFDISFTKEIDQLHQDSFLLKLIPKSEENYDYLIIEVNPRDYFVERFLTFDPLGSVAEYRFNNLRKADLPDSTFRFTIPKGVEVIDETELK